MVDLDPLYTTLPVPLTAATMCQYRIREWNTMASTGLGITIIR